MGADSGAGQERVDLVLPHYGEEALREGNSPSLFLTAVDPINDFKKYLKKMSSKWTLLNADTPFSHLSKFIHLDLCSDTDDGRFHRQTDKGEGALDSIGRLVPEGWLWSGQGWSTLGFEYLLPKHSNLRIPMSSQLNLAQHRSHTLA